MAETGAELKQLLKPAQKQDKFVMYTKVAVMAVGAIVLICVVYFAMGTPCNASNSGAAKKIACGIGDGVSALGKLMATLAANWAGILGGALGAYIFVALLRAAVTWKTTVPKTKLMKDTVNKKIDGDRAQATDFDNLVQSEGANLSAEQIANYRAKAEELRAKADEAEKLLEKGTEGGDVVDGGG